MEPLLDENSNGIRIIPKSEEDIHIGDIISFEKNKDLIIHRVIDKGVDNNGTYFITKGDNNNVSDGKIRFEDIRYITIGVIW
jgi:signal peptidase I